MLLALSAATAAVDLTLGQETHTPSAYVGSTLPDAAESFPAAPVGVDVNTTNNIYYTCVGYAADDCIDVGHAADGYNDN